MDQREVQDEWRWLLPVFVDSSSAEFLYDERGWFVEEYELLGSFVSFSLSLLISYIIEMGESFTYAYACDVYTQASPDIRPLAFVY